MNRALLIAWLAFAPLAALAQDGVINLQTDQSQLTRNKGQLPGTTTNDNASAGNVGEVIASIGMQASGTVTFTNGTATVTDAATCTTNQRTGCIGIGNVVNFTTTGGLPTNFSTGTNYYVIATGFVSGTSYQVSTTPFGTAVTAGSAGTGTQTRVNSTVGCGNGTNCTIAAVSLTAGDWNCSGAMELITTGTTTLVQGFIGTTNNSATGAIAESKINIPSPSAAIDVLLKTGIVRVLPASTTTYFLEGVGLFSSGTSSYLGSLICSRPR